MELRREWIVRLKVIGENLVMSLHDGTSERLEEIPLADLQKESVRVKIPLEW